MMYRLVLAAIASICIGNAAYPQDNPPNLRDPSMIAAGHDLFLQKQCAHCHGPDGKGGINLARRELDPKGVFQSITDGRDKSGLRMPAWRGVMSDEEIWKVTAYVLSISQHPK